MFQGKKPKLSRDSYARARGSARVDPCLRATYAHHPLYYVCSEFQTSDRHTHAHQLDRRHTRARAAMRDSESEW
jgi:hypothetical protein